MSYIKSQHERGNHMQIQQIPETGFLRLKQIIGDEKRGIVPIIPVKRSCWLKGVEEGRFPAPVKLSQRAIAWRVEDIRALIASFGKDA